VRLARAVATGLVALALGCDRGATPAAPEAPASSSQRESLRLTMRALREKTRDLDAILRSHREMDARDHARVVELLSEIESLATGLDELPPEVHPSSLRLGRLRADARRAIETAADDPPNFYFAGAISGACVYCHSRPL
jgi:hypothetical protein